MTRTARLLSLLAAATTAVALLTPTSAVAAPTAKGDADYHRPSVGRCHPGLDAAAASDHEKRVPCSAKHRLVTIAAPLLPEGVDWNDDDAVYSLAERHCRTAEIDHLGRESRVDMSAYTYIFFVPTEAERAHGASWVQCDLGLEAGGRLLPLPETVEPLGALPLPDRYARCLTGKLGQRTACTQHHDFRAIATKRRAGTKYPSTAKWIEFAYDTCPGVAKRQGYDKFNYTYPSKYAWRSAHQRLLVCYGGTTD